jgi:hypothetical protein
MFVGLASAASDNQYAVVARLMPLKVVRCLEVIQAYPVSDSVLRAKLLKKCSKRIAWMSRLVNAIKEQSYNISFIKLLNRSLALFKSTIAVLDIEHVRSVNYARSSKDTSRLQSKAAYKAAKKLFKLSCFDGVCELLVNRPITNNTVRYDDSLCRAAALSTHQPGEPSFFIALKKLSVECGKCVQAFKQTADVAAAINSFTEPVRKRYSLRRAARTFSLPFGS